jgi:uncharacterized NAD-dependent epimerase/dehydratase family protein
MLGAIAQVEQETGLPCIDAVYFGAKKLLDAVMLPSTERPAD